MSHHILLAFTWVLGIQTKPPWCSVSTLTTEFLSKPQAGFHMDCGMFQSLGHRRHLPSCPLWEHSVCGQILPWREMPVGRDFPKIEISVEEDTPAKESARTVMRMRSSWTSQPSWPSAEAILVLRRKQSRRCPDNQKGKNPCGLWSPCFWVAYYSATVN